MTADYLLVDASDTAISAAFLAEIHDPHVGRAVVVADPDRHAVTILQDVLLGIGPDRDGQGWPRQTEEARTWVKAWVAGRQIRDLVIANADVLSGEHFRELLHLAQNATRVWLLARDGMRLTRRAREVSVDTFIAHFELERELARDMPGELSRFPSVPLDGILSFRRSCARMLSVDEFRLVDSLLYRSCVETDGRLRGVPSSQNGAWELVEPILIRPYTADATLTALRGCQLAAFVHGLHLRFDTDLVFARLEARTIGSASTAHLLMADADPAQAAMLICESLGASAGDLAQLQLAAVEPDGLRVWLAEEAKAVPLALAPILATHYEARMSATPDRSPQATPLFVSERNPRRRLSAQAIGARLDRAATRLGAARGDPMSFDPSEFTVEPFSGWHRAA